MLFPVWLSHVSRACPALSKHRVGVEPPFWSDCWDRGRACARGGGVGPQGRGVWTAKTVKRPRQQPAHPQYANYWAPLTRKRHTMPHSAQPQHTNYWAPRTRKRHQQEHRPQRPTERSGRQNAATRRNMRREERVTVQCPVKEQQPDGTSHGG